MKSIKNQLSLIILLILPLISKAQEYMPFPLDNAVWYSVYSYPWPYPPYIYFRTYKYEANGDTIINDKIYTKFYNCLTVEGENCLYYRGAYRVEIDSSRVYYFDEWESEERLVYDFNLIPGDSIISGGISVFCLDTGLVVMNDGSTHKYQTMLVPVANNCIQIWVTGVGSMGRPLLEPFAYCSYTFESRYDLTCYFYQEEQIYEWLENPYFEGCIGTNVEIKELTREELFTVSPNPVSNHSIIISNNADENLFDYQIINEDGMILKNEYDIRIDDIIIKKGDFTHGLYILRLYSQKKEQFYTIKFIIN
jgi:hypothetical protein